MILEITPPPSEARTSRTRLWQRIAAYSIGLVASATVVGVTAGAIGAVVRASTPFGVGYDWLWVASVALFALTYSMHEVAIVRLPMPQIHWQVPARWSRYGKSAQALLYGVVLGIDIATLIPYATFYVLLLFEAMLGVQGGAALGFVYGLARASSTLWGVILSHRRGTTVPATLRIVSAMSWFRMANGLVLALVGEVLLGALVISR